MYFFIYFYFLPYTRVHYNISRYFFIVRINSCKYFLRFLQLIFESETNYESET